MKNDQFQIQNGKYNWSPEGTKRAIALCLSITEQILSSGADVVIANTFTRYRFVEAYYKLAKKYGADFEVIRCTADYGNIHNVPTEVLDSMRNNFDDWPGEKIV